MNFSMGGGLIVTDTNMMNAWDTWPEPPSNTRIIKRGARTIQQVRIGYDWCDLAIWGGDPHHPFRYGKPWHHHLSPYERKRYGLHA